MLLQFDFTYIFFWLDAPPIIHMKLILTHSISKPFKINSNLFEANQFFLPKLNFTSNINFNEFFFSIF